MLTLYHAPQSRSGSILHLLAEMGIEDRVALDIVTIRRMDGSGASDATNPHPEHKVPLLVDDGHMIRERGAIILYLTDMFDSPLGRPVGDPSRGDYLAWLFWYQGVLEPVMVMKFAGIRHPALEATFRDADTAMARLNEVLARQPYLLGQDYSAADLLIASPFITFPDFVPDLPALKDWVARCADRPALRRVKAEDAGRLAAV